MFFASRPIFPCFWTQNEPSVSLICNLLVILHIWDSKIVPKNIKMIMKNRFFIIALVVWGGLLRVKTSFIAIVRDRAWYACFSPLMPAALVCRILARW